MNYGGLGSGVGGYHEGSGGSVCIDTLLIETLEGLENLSLLNSIVGDP